MERGYRIVRLHSFRLNDWGYNDWIVDGEFGMATTTKDWLDGQRRVHIQVLDGMRKRLWIYAIFHWCRYCLLETETIYAETKQCG